MITRRIAVGAIACGCLYGIDTREPAGKFKARTLDGESFDNQSIAGKVVLIQFWATWCQFCKRDEPAVETITREFADQGLIVLAVDVGESRKKVKHYLDNSERSCKIVLTEDTNLAAWFAARSYPYYVLVDRNGKIAGTQKGSGGEASLRRLLSKAGLE